MNTTLPLNDLQRRLVEDNLPLIWQTIARYITYNEEVCGLGLDDLYQEGAFALCRAAGTYRAESGTPFSAYARPVIRNHLLDYCRRIQNSRRVLPTIPLDGPDSGGRPAHELLAPEGGDGPMDRRIDALYLVALLDHGRRSYNGVARRGIAAMELKLQGCSGAEIARLYRTSPNNVGAWISRAASKLRHDALTGLGTNEDEKKAAGF